MLALFNKCTGLQTGGLDDDWLERMTVALEGGTRGGKAKPDHAGLGKRWKRWKERVATA